MHSGSRPQNLWQRIAAGASAFASHAALTTAHGATATPTSNSSVIVKSSAADGRIAAGFSRPRQRHSRAYSWSHDVGATSWTSVGSLAVPTQVGTASTSSQDNAHHPWEQHVCAGATNDAGGRKGSLKLHKREWKDAISIVYSMGPNIAAVRHWVVLSSADMDQVGNPTTQSAVGFVYDTGIDGTAFWRVLSCDGASNVTRTATSVAAENDTNRPQGWTFTWELDASEVRMFIDDTYITSLTTTLPAASTLMQWNAHVTSLAAAAKRCKVSRVDVLSA